MNEKRLRQQLSTFDTIINKYDRSTPLARFLTQYFKENKQMGSTDRRIASRLVYGFFRLGRALPERPSQERVVLADFLCNGESDFANLIFPSCFEHADPHSLSKRIQIVQERFGLELEDVFPLIDQVSKSIEKEQFLVSHLVQPDLFIRIHPKHGSTVKTDLRRCGIAFEELGPFTLSFRNGTNLDQCHAIRGKYEVQDFSSQQTGQLFKPAINESWWDACAGSGGKSILLKQLEPTVELLVSDSRNSILRNLDERFDKVGIADYRRKILDLTKSDTLLRDELFDGIILDAPCSGSGTWGRTPEMMATFNSSQLRYYADLQKQIAVSVIKHIKPNKPLIYITCSVFEEENERIVQFFEEGGMVIEEMKYFKGYEDNADTLFAARLIR